MFTGNVWVIVPTRFEQWLAPTGKAGKLLLKCSKEEKKYVQNDWARKGGEILGQKMGS